MSLAKYIIAGLGAAASVAAVPYPASNSSSTAFATGGTSTTLSTITSTPTSTATSINVPNLPATSAAAIAKDVAAELTNVQKFNQLLTVDGLGAELLSPDEVRQRTVFNFDFDAANKTGNGGKVLAANVGTLPILVDQGLSTTIVQLEACSMNSPHTHPRAAEWLTVIDGSLRTGFMLENGFLADKTPQAQGGTGRLTTDIDNVLSPLQGTLFPMGSIHFQFNDNCEPATFIATLNSEDPGTSQIAQNFFFQDDDVVEVALGDVKLINGENISMFRNKLPANLVKSMDACHMKCGTVVVN